eukprot:6181988-Pleurochrysis_carterae.AAC.1
MLPPLSRRVAWGGRSPPHVSVVLHRGPPSHTPDPQPSAHPSALVCVPSLPYARVRSGACLRPGSRHAPSTAGLWLGGCRPPPAWWPR